MRPRRSSVSPAALLPARRPMAIRLAVVLPVLVSLVAGVAGGLVRAGVGVPFGPARWLEGAVVAHAFLMVCAFMGTVIGIERAVAARHPLSTVGPLASGVAGPALLGGQAVAAAWLVALASLSLVAVSVVLARRQRAEHTVLLVVAALAWAAGSLLHARGAQAGAVIPWWFAFLVLTVAAERLEMARLMRRRKGVSSALHCGFGVMLLGAALSAVSGTWGGALYGLSLMTLAAWLLCFDIARRTVRAHGLSRYMAVCLLLGYAWLFVAGAAWTATSLGLPFRDAALHGLGLGFVFSMMLAHAPVILPAIARVKLLFGRAFYVPLLLLHVSLVVRLAAGPLDARALAAGAAGNSLAMAAFAATVVASAVAWRLRYPPSPPGQAHGIAAEHR